MAKNHKKGEGVKLVGSPSELIKMLVIDATNRKAVMKQVIDHGPHHKQVLSALLLRRLYKLVKTVESKTGKSFVEQKGFIINIEKDNEEVIIPLPCPILVSAGFNKKAIVKSISKAPVHEAIEFAMYLQVVEWAVDTLTKQPIDKSKKARKPAKKIKLKIDKPNLSRLAQESDGVSVDE